MSKLSARLLVIGGLGLILVGVGGGIQSVPLGTAGGMVLGFALGIGFTTREVARLLGRR